jgi:hypothetical protein
MNLRERHLTDESSNMQQHFLTLCSAVLILASSTRRQYVLKSNYRSEYVVSSMMQLSVADTTTNYFLSTIRTFKDTIVGSIL